MEHWKEVVTQLMSEADTVLADLTTDVEMRSAAGQIKIVGKYWLLVLDKTYPVVVEEEQPIVTDDN